MVFQQITVFLVVLLLEMIYFLFINIRFIRFNYRVGRIFLGSISNNYLLTNKQINRYNNNCKEIVQFISQLKSV
jgi:hypothetical protein